MKIQREFGVKDRLLFLPALVKGSFVRYFIGYTSVIRGSRRKVVGDSGSMQ